jgi:tetratricopeptide (TPR) repeat protein
MTFTYFFLYALKMLPLKTFRAIILILTTLLLGFSVSKGQDPASLIEEGKVLERKFKEDEALEKYKQAFAIQPGNVLAASKSAELSGNMGHRASGSVARLAWMNQGLGFAEAAVRADSNASEASAAMALAYRNLAITEEKRDKATEYLKQWKHWSEKALLLDSSHARAAFLLGAWHLEVLTQGSLRKASSKILYGGLPEANIKNAIALMEVCKEAEPYFCPNFLELAKAYNYNKNYEKAIQTLERLLKLPSRRQDDAAIKEEGKILLQKLQ